MSIQSKEEPASPDHWIEVVREKVGAIRFGSVQITVHEGRVTLVEAIEKTRIAADRPEPPAAGAKARRNS